MPSGEYTMSYSGNWAVILFGELNEWMEIYPKRLTKNNSAKITYWMVLIRLTFPLSMATPYSQP